MGSISGRWKRGNGSVPPDAEEMPFILKDVAGLKHLLFPVAAAVQMCTACLELEFRRAICVSAHLLPSSVSVARRRLEFKVGAPPTFLVLNPEMTQFSARSWVELKEKPRLTRREEDKKKRLLTSALMPEERGRVTAVDRACRLDSFCCLSISQWV